VDGIPDPDGPSRGQRRLVLGALGVLLLGGLVGMEAWPVTAWRLFSEPRGTVQAGFALQAVEADGTVTRVALGGLPMGYRMAGHPLEDAVETGSGDEAAVCTALLEQVQRDRPAATELRILHTRRRLAQLDGGWGSVEVGAEEVARCTEADLR
jgi:hypothetical protein